jgi:hypothetical protein
MRMNEYYTKVRQILDDRYQAFGMMHQMDPFPRQVFVILTRLLESDAQGEFFINVNASELGDSHDRNYSNFVAAIAFASARRRYLINRDNAYPNLIDGDLTFSRYRPGKNIFMNVGNTSVLLSDRIAQREPAFFPFKNKGPRLLSTNEYEYNNQNAETSMRKHREWLLSAGLIDDDRGMRILNGINRSDLIICHDVPGLTSLLDGIPYATIGDRIVYSSPCEPLLWFSRDGNENVLRRLRKSFFENVFFVGDVKYQDGGPWSYHNGYLSRNIYIGSGAPTNQAVSYYRFPNSELNSLFGVQEQRIDLSLAPDMGAGKIEQYLQVHREAGLGLNPFLAIHRTLRLRTFPMDEESVDRYLFWHRRILNENLVANDEGNRHYRNAIEAFEKLLESYRDGNPAKMKIFQESIDSPRTSLIVSVRDEDEVRYANNKYRIPKGSHVTRFSNLRSAISSFAYETDRHRHSIFLFLSYGSGYDDLLKMLDDYMLSGRLVFVSEGTHDTRVSAMLGQRDAFEAGMAGDPSRQAITGIEFVAPAQEPGDLAIEDFHGGYPAELPARAGQSARYQVAIEEEGQRREYRTGSMCIRLAELVSIEQVIRGDDIIIYSSDPDSFEEAWRAIHGPLCQQIDASSAIWREYLQDLLVHHENDPDLLFRRLRESGMRVAYNSFSRYIDEDAAVKFPNSISLRAIESLCMETFPDAAAGITQRFTTVRQADRAYDQTRQELGTDLSGGMLCRELNQPLHQYGMTLNLIEQHNGIFNRMRETCLHTGCVIEIRRN